MGGIEDPDRAAATAASTPGAGAAALEAIDGLVTAIDADRAAGLFGRWGLATAIDARTGEALLPQALFEALHERAGLEATWPIGNAGLLQTYGSLLAPAAAADRNRERWLDADLAAGLGLDPAHFAPREGSRTLLDRATEAAAVLLASGGEFSWYSLAEGRATRAVLSHEHDGSRALAYAVAPAPGTSPLLVALLPVTQAETVRRDLDEAASRLRWNAA
ncbi:amino acid deaminase [Microbacterium sp. NPDC056052]|uniref:amino acid deaminase n=1 Tax=Microbacterium sp. NPDC056052 TaxID=3345695 RepID=UPI0035DF15ED